MNTKIVKAVFDSAGTDSAGVSNKTAATHKLGVFIPANAIIVRAFYDVITTFASTAGGTDKATIALSSVSAADLVAAVAIETGTPWDAGIHHCLAGAPVVGSNASTLDAGTAVIIKERMGASMLKTTVNIELAAVVGTQAITAGKLNLYVEYLMTDVVV